MAPRVPAPAIGKVVLAFVLHVRDAVTAFLCFVLIEPFVKALIITAEPNIKAEPNTHSHNAHSFFSVFAISCYELWNP